MNKVAHKLLKIFKMSKFINVRRGEIAELKVELNSPKLEKRR